MRLLITNSLWAAVNKQINC